MLGVFAAHTVAVPVKFTPHGVMQLALPVVVLEETTEKPPSHEKEKERKKKNPKRAARISKNQGMREF